MSVNNVGSKRRREPEELGDEGEEGPRVIRIKTEKELGDNFNYEDEDSCGPPTPPVPRSIIGDEEEDRPPTPPIPRARSIAGDVIVKREVESAVVEDIVSQPIPSSSGSQTSFIISDARTVSGTRGHPAVEVEDVVESSPEPTPSTSRRQTSFIIGSSSHAGWGQPYVKSEPRGYIDEPRKSRENGDGSRLPNGHGHGVSSENGVGGSSSSSEVNGEKDEDIRSAPSISSFFSFTTSEQIQPGLPNAMTADIKYIPVARPQTAHYNSIRPEEELNYVEESGEKINTIPMFNGEKHEGSDVDSDASGNEKEEEPLHPHGEKLTRYFERNKVYEKYDFDSRKVDASRLAVYEKRTHILNTLEKNRVVIIEGFTGCGKTTQVPQFIMDKCRKEKSFCNIVVTQPRKIAAISVAKRVCIERNFQLGTVVGYQVGMEVKKDKDDTLVTFMTTGVLLQKLISQRSLKEFTHIIIDEVHERDLESDFLLLVIKRIMAQDHSGKERHVKLILMSATIDTNKFERYFQFKSTGGDIRGPPVIKIPFIARHRVDEYYLNDILIGDKADLLNLIESNMDRDKATIQEDIYGIAVSCIRSLDDIERECNPAEVDPRMRKAKQGPQRKRGAVLVFLPGMEEIKTLQRALDAARKKILQEQGPAADTRWAVFPLHSSVTAEDQNRIFEHPGDYFRKIILSTNIAESSVTVPDIEYVIDFCLTKSLCVDQTTNFTTLRMVWASKSQCVQRRGRAGRVADGKVYRLVPRQFYMELDQDIIPEMKRSNLETIILMCKKFDLDCPRNLLRDALDPPNLSNLERAVSTLKELGALTIVKKEGNHIKYDTCDGDLTFVGKVMAALPIPQQCTRLILFGHCFGVMKEAIIIAAGLSVKNPFQTGFQKQLDTYLEKMKHAKKTFSDLFALYHVYKYWVCNYCESGAGGARKQVEYRWARGAMVHLSVLREIKSTVELLEERLKKLGIEDKDGYALPTNARADADPVELTSNQGLFLKLSIAGAFYPNYFLRRRPDSRQYEREINKELNGYDAFRTVYFKGFPQEHIGKLYAKHVADYLADGLSIPTVKFEGQKVFAMFDTSIGNTIGPFSTGIYRALKLRQLRNENLEFRVLWKEHERRALQEWDSSVRRRRGIPCPSLATLPAVDCNVVTVKVQHVMSPSKFWVVIDSNISRLERIFTAINDNFVRIPLPETRLFPNCLCLAPFEGLHYRAKVLRIEWTTEKQCLVYFVDYGNCQWVPSRQLSDFSPAMTDQGIEKVPCLGMECRLQKIKPNRLHGLAYTEECINVMRKFCIKAPCTELKIFSVYQSIIVGELVGFDPKNRHPDLDVSLNDTLIKPNTAHKIFAETAPEPYLSMENHRIRQRSVLMGRSEKEAAGAEQIGDSLDLDFVDPPAHDTKQPVTLKGPWSPLEMSFQALVHCSTTKPVKIDNNSVNSVSLDHEPTASNSRMLVASNIGVADKSQTVMIRDSTVMFPIPGILQLVCMIFAPKIELRVDRNLTKYVGLLCGCGTVPVNPNDPNADRNLAVHPDNDMEIVFDTEIDDNDVEQVNTIRYYLNNILKEQRTANKAEHHKLLRDAIIKLIRQPRNKVEEEIWPQEEYVWNRIDEDSINHSVGRGMTFNHDDIYQPHLKVKLNDVTVVENLVWEGGY